MQNLPKCYGIIPTRYASSRFTGKPLAEILGKPMFWHVHNRASQCPHLEKVVLATDDERIFTAAEALDIPVLMTGAEHTCGTERVLEAARLLEIPEESVIVNIQGDEPTLEPDMLTELVMPFRSDAIQVTTLAHAITAEQAQDPDQVKVVMALDDSAIYFSRSAIPHARDGKNSNYHGHLGIYAFRLHILEKFVNLEKGPLEQSEKLEQLRLLENGFSIHVVKTVHQGCGVDRLENIAGVEEILRSKQ